MFILKCDKCHREILSKDYCLRVEVQEEKYMGNLEFLKDNNCLSASKVLCDNCNTQLQEFFNCETVYY